MRGKGSRIYITYNKRTRKYYVGQTINPYNRYKTHKNTYGREVIADFPALDAGSSLDEREREMIHFCEGIGLPLENKLLLLRLYPKRELDVPRERLDAPKLDISMLDTSISHGNRQLVDFSDPPIMILTSLAEGPKHGYAIVKDIEHLAGVHLGPGTLYGAIARLKDQGLIEPLKTEERRRPYRLTATGVAFLQKRLTRLESFASMGLQRLAGI